MDSNTKKGGSTGQKTTQYSKKQLSDSEEEDDFDAIWEKYASNDSDSDSESKRNDRRAAARYGGESIWQKITQYSKKQQSDSEEEDDFDAIWEKYASNDSDSDSESKRNDRRSAAGYGGESIWQKITLYLIKLFVADLSEIFLSDGEGENSVISPTSAPHQKPSTQPEKSRIKQKVFKSDSEEEHDDNNAILEKYAYDDSESKRSGIRAAARYGDIGSQTLGLLTSNADAPFPCIPNKDDHEYSYNCDEDGLLNSNADAAFPCIPKKDDNEYLYNCDDDIRYMGPKVATQPESSYIKQKVFKVVKK